ncbi:MAG TPA: glycerophosphodiester phosphodiesterase family protein [Parachlamydiaceae bacterium]|nr:glycerophosphodiester phosphodiesterase family protein [Parachlamydiaceae bacterium]
MPTAHIIAHRGGAKEVPENTMAALKWALDLKVDCIEIDVRLSKEGIPVVLHDPSAARMIGALKSPQINRLTLSQIQEFDVGLLFGNAYFGEKIPTLLDVLNLNWKKTGLMIEIKKGKQRAKVLVDAVFDVLASVKMNLPLIIIGSFSVEVVKEIQNHPLLAELNIEVIGIVEKPEMIPRFLELDIKRLALWYKIITPSLIQPILKKNIDIWSFTVDDIKIAQFLISLGINGIISNVPKMMLKSGIFYLH